MALSKGINSYLTVDEADSYFGDRFGADAWTNADPITKAKALVTATDTLESLKWAGSVIDPQALAFPRVGAFFDPHTGTMQQLTPIPNRILNAVCELAIHLLENGLPNSGGTVHDLVIGPITLTGIKRGQTLPDVVLRLIQPLKLNHGSNSWWRAN
jgi:hypothetical protein